MKIATWNVNSLRAREERVLAWMQEHEPDVLCLQETKVQDDKFPADGISDLGYEIAIHGQKTYNGVAILSREPITDVERGFGDDEDDDQARFIAGTTCGIRAMSAYVPNGASVDSDKFVYKMRWLERLRAYLARHVPADQPALLCGDFNVAPDAIDVYDPVKWEGQCLFTPQERAALKEAQGASQMTDLLRKLHPEEQMFSWWDYRQLGFAKGRGLRIDHFFVTAPLVERATAAHVDRNSRKGRLPSDHAAVIAEFS